MLTHTTQTTLWPPLAYTAREPQAGKKCNECLTSVLTTTVAIVAHSVFSHPLTRVAVATTCSFAVVVLCRQAFEEHSLYKSLEHSAHELTVFFPQIQIVALIVALLCAFHLPFISLFFAQFAGALGGLIKNIEINRAISIMS